MRADATLYMKRADDPCGRVRVTYTSQPGGLAPTMRWTDRLHEFDIYLDGFVGAGVAEIE
jgi:hypothetical protein